MELLYFKSLAMLVLLNYASARKKMASLAGVFSWVTYMPARQPKNRPPHSGECMGVVKSWFLMHFWQILRNSAIVMMSETVGIDTHEIAGEIH